MQFSAKLFCRPVVTAAALVCPTLIPSCEERKGPAKEAMVVEEERFFEGEPEVIEHLHRNQLGQEPSDFLRSRADDAVNWQGWSPTLFEEAKQEQRLVFALIGSSRFTTTTHFFDQLKKHPELIKRLNDQYVCTLVDIDVHPEMALQMAALCVEIKRPVSFPVIAWISHEGSPVTWLPLTEKDINTIDELFDKSESLVARLWKDDPRYVIDSSAQADEGRAIRQKLEPAEDASLETLRSVTLSSAGALAALYDPITETMDGGGGLLPCSVLRMAGAVGQSSIADKRLKDSLRGFARGLSGTLNRSAIRDPLDRGFFSARSSAGWGIPNRLKAVDTQSTLATAYAQNAEWTGQPEVLQIAQEVMAFVELELASGGESIGNFWVMDDDKIGDHALFWSQERVRDLLPADVFPVIEKAYGISGLGNVPPEADPRRKYFRKNTFAEKLTAAETAEALKLNPDTTAQLLESGRKILLAQRQELIERSNLVLKDETRITSVNANYATALARLACITGDERYLTKAQSVLTYLRSRHYSPEGGLVRIGTVGGRRKIRARGIDYSSLIAALFEVYRMDLDPSHLIWAHTLAEEAIASLANEDGLLSECPVDEGISVSKVFSTSMIFSDSTWGSIYGPLERLNQLTKTQALNDWAETIRTYLLPLVAQYPMSHSDFLISSLVPLTDTVVLLEGDPGDAGFKDLHGLLLKPKHDAVTILHVTESLPAPLEATPTGKPGATVLVGGQEAGKATTAAELRILLGGEGS